MSLIKFVTRRRLNYITGERRQEDDIMLDENFVTLEIGKAKHIALVAHDGKKK